MRILIFAASNRSQIPFMLQIKRLYTFILQTFIPLFLMTFGICLFIVLMQFLWKYVDDMVGKGLELDLLLEMFFYAGLSLVPMSLPLSILLASLMTFGNLGESFELTAIKASGVSLLKTMKPIIICISMIAVGAYFFQNNIMPISQVKLWTLMNSMKQKSPELDIPEGSFYKEIPGYNLYVKKKDKVSGMMYDMMIYDFSKGFENATVIVADSGKLKMLADKMNLVLTLHSGESFENLREQQENRQNKNIAYRRETFSKKEVLIDYNSNFNMMDESVMQGKYIGKNRQELSHYIDSVTVVSDSTNAMYASNLRQYGYMQSMKNNRGYYGPPAQHEPDTFKMKNFNVYFDGLPLSGQLSVAVNARSKAENIKNEYMFKAINQDEQMSSIRQHEMEWNRKYTLSFACLIFLFIGAPLGAIIRKGGLGMPVVISVFFFLFYYTIDTFGVKMARQGIWPAWQGMWLSSIVLFPLGVFLTYKSVNDSIIFNPDAYVNAFRRIFGKRETRNYSVKEIIMQYPDYPDCLNKLEELDLMCEQYLKNQQKIPDYFSFWKMDFNQTELKQIIRYQEDLIEELCNSDRNIIVGKLMDYPILTIIHSEFLSNNYIRNTCKIFFPLGLCFYFIGRHKRKRRMEDMHSIRKVNQDLRTEIERIIM